MKSWAVSCGRARPACPSPTTGCASPTAWEFLPAPWLPFRRRRTYFSAMSRHDEILAKPRPDPDDLAVLLGADAPAEQARLLAAAYAVKVRELRPVVYFRGLFELSNRCNKDCLYCGIRRSNQNLERYTIPVDEILAGARWAYEQGYGSVVLQSGERSDPAFVDLITELVTKIRALSREIPTCHHPFAGRAVRGYLPHLVPGRRRTLSAAHRNQRPRSLPSASPGGSQLGAPARLPAPAPRYWLPARLGRDDRLARPEG